MNNFLLEIMTTFRLNRPLLSIGKEPFYLVQELLNKPKFTSRDFSVTIQNPVIQMPESPICILQNQNTVKQTAVAFFHDRISLKVSYMKSPTPSNSFDVLLPTMRELLLDLSGFLAMKWGVKGVSVFGNFMLLDTDKDFNVAKLIADGTIQSGYFTSIPIGIELKYKLSRTCPKTNLNFDDFIHIFKAKFNGYVAGKMNPDNIGIQREIYFNTAPGQYNDDRLSSMLDTVKMYFSEKDIKGLINVRE